MAELTIGEVGFIVILLLVPPVVIRAIESRPVLFYSIRKGKRRSDDAGRIVAIIGIVDAFGKKLNLPII